MHLSKAFFVSLLPLIPILISSSGFVAGAPSSVSEISSSDPRKTIREVCQSSDHRKYLKRCCSQISGWLGGRVNHTNFKDINGFLKIVGTRCLLHGFSDNYYQITCSLCLEFLNVIGLPLQGRDSGHD
ncbi:hypothetical protein PM082_009753 [Marasmius tenuissimus]|nr:hypothetical protein PM082_009753 [Marasmius tenuissimus]